MFQHNDTIRRNSHMEPGILYFWTATINGWQHLLENDIYKDIILDSLGFLSKKEKIDVFSFVVMPNHTHLIWRAKSLNGNENPQASFAKFTAHRFQQLLSHEPGDDSLLPYRVKAANKKFEFWQRDSLAIPLFSRRVAIQKLNYIHNNPLQNHWKLADSIEAYKYSSANFYQTGLDEFGFLKNLFDEIQQGGTMNYWID